MLQEFKEFALRGNVVDMAVGIIIGAAFSTIVNSMVNDIIMPPIGVVTGGIDFSNLFVTMSGDSYDSLAAAKQAGAPTINYGVFINNQKIAARTPLLDCDVIKIGDTTIVYTLDDAADARSVREASKRFGQGHMHTRTQ